MSNIKDTKFSEKLQKSENITETQRQGTNTGRNEVTRWATGSAGPVAKTRKMEDAIKAARDITSQFGMNKSPYSSEDSLHITEKEDESSGKVLESPIDTLKEKPLGREASPESYGGKILEETGTNDGKIAQKEQTYPGSEHENKRPKNWRLKSLVKALKKLDISPSKSEKDYHGAESPLKVPGAEFAPSEPGAEFIPNEGIINIQWEQLKGRAKNWQEQRKARKEEKRREIEARKAEDERRWRKEYREAEIRVRKEANINFYGDKVGRTLNIEYYGDSYEKNQLRQAMEKNIETYGKPEGYYKNNQEFGHSEYYDYD